MADTEVRLAYGDHGLLCSFPSDATTVIEPRFEPAERQPRRLLRDALESPIDSPRLRQVVTSDSRIAVSICDITRPQPRRLMIEAILAELEGIAQADQLTLLVATGTHRANTDEELLAMLGPDLVEACNVINHNGRDPGELRYLGVFGDNVPVSLNRHWVESDVRITTGFVEPHFFAGFSGGPKLVAPGLAGLETVLTLHDARRIASPNATWGVCEGNPVHDDIRDIAGETSVDFAFDVILNRDKAITHAFAGELLSMHSRAREVCRQVSMRPVDGLFDIVVTTNAGYPLDQNLYQAVKGMSAAMNIVKPGGTILVAAECRDGLPAHGSYGELLASAGSIEEVRRSIETSERTMPDQWQVQIQARIQERVRVLVKADGLSDDQIRAAHLEPCHDISRFVKDELKRLGPTARVCILPEGPQTIPYLTDDVASGNKLPTR
ncbi:MAG TPA: nickel-dependent lactate racemase [Acidimicrobiia bacterium]|nr:nickel-dependent lactate racemase [Acidimicrobiia bacterium]